MDALARAVLTPRSTLVAICLRSHSAVLVLVACRWRSA